jgi:hypothetical protein
MAKILRRPAGQRPDKKHRPFRPDISRSFAAAFSGTFPFRSTSEVDRKRSRFLRALQNPQDLAGGLVACS